MWRGVPWACCFLVQVLFGCNGVLIRKFTHGAADSIEPLIFILYRDVGAFLALLTVGCVVEGWRCPTLRDCHMLLAVGSCGMFLSPFGNVLGIHWTSPAVASMWQSLIPVVTAGLGVWTGIEAMPPQGSRKWMGKVGGLISGVIGATFMIAPELQSGTNLLSSSAVAGMAALAVNVAGIAGFVLLQKRWVFLPGGSHHHWATRPVTLAAWSNAAGACVMSVASLYFLLLGRWDVYTDFAPEAYYSLVFAALAVSGGCFGLISFCNRYLPAGVVTAFWPLQIPVAVSLSFMFIPDTVVSVTQIIGGTAMIVGLVLVTVASRDVTSPSDQPVIDEGDVDGQEDILPMGELVVEASKSL